jgi:P-type Cu+ transporter
MPIKDPVCGMEIEPEAAFATRQYKRQTFYFCSNNCVQQFDADPTRYAALVSATTGIPALTDGTHPARIALPIAGRPAQVGRPGPGTSHQRRAWREQDQRQRERGAVFVDYDPSRANVADLLEAMRSAGFTPDGQTLRLMSIDFQNR